MAKMCLIEYTGRIAQIVNVGEEFEIYEGEGAAMKWVTCAQDSVTDKWIMKDGAFIENDVIPTDYDMQRRVAYGDIGAQLDMMYHDQIESTTTWKDHIAKVKKDVPAPSEQPSYDDIALTGTIEKPAWEA